MTGHELTTSILHASAAVSLGALVVLMCMSLAWGAAQREPGQRSFLDQPPWGFWLAWWPIQVLSALMGLLPFGWRHKQMEAVLRRAGLEFRLTPLQLRAAQALLTLCGLAVASWAMVWVNAVMGKTSVTGDHPMRAWLPLFAVVGLALLGWWQPLIWMRGLERRRRTAVARSMPFFLDLITMCVEAGLSVQGAMAQAVAKGPQGGVRDEFQRVLRDIRAGKTRVDALREMAQRLNDPSVTNFVACVVQGERMGMSMAPLLRMQAEQRLNERFVRAEKMALQAPVKMLFPLAVFIFPCTFIILFFPIVMRLGEVTR
jgi:tight adherence protein C